LRRFGLCALLGLGTFADKLHVLARKLELDEIVINTWTFEAAARRHSYELLAGAFGLVAAPITAT
jgi:hypothetical protein